MFANKNMGDPTKWTYERDTTRPAVAAGSWRNAALRLTVQPTPRHKFNVFWDQQVPCQGAGVLGSDAGCRQSGRRRDHLRRGGRVEPALQRDRLRRRSARI